MVIPPEEDAELVVELDEEPELEEELEFDEEPEEPDESEAPDELELDEEPEEDGAVVTGALPEAVRALLPALPQPVANTAAAVSRHNVREDSFKMFMGSLFKSVE